MIICLLLVDIKGVSGIGDFGIEFLGGKVFFFVGYGKGMFFFFFS